MGLLSRVTGKARKNIDLEITAEPTELAPGDEVKVHFTVGGELDESCRAVVAYLVGYGTYRENEQYTEGTEIKYREVERAMELHKEEREFPVELGDNEVTFKLPETATPSSMKVVKWRVGVKVDIEKASDATEIAELTVRLRPDQMPTDKVTLESEDGVGFADVPSAVRAGDTLKGNLTVAVKDDVSVTAVRLRLHCDATLGTGKGSGSGGFFGQMNRELAPSFGNSAHKDSKQGELNLAEKRKFEAGSTEQIPFSLEIPDGAAPSTKFERGHVNWRLEAVLDRRMRGDLTAEMPVTIC